jgi:two-component system LytT family response regulator
MIRAMLVDDEESAIRWLSDVLSSQPGVEVVGTATSVEEALTLMNTIRPEVVFLDISMPRQCGMTLFASVDAGIRIVLVTAHDDRAIEAFEAGAFDYLLKPVTAARVGKTVERLRSSLRPPGAVPSAPVERVTITTPSGTVFLPIDQVLWIEARQNYSLIHRAGAAPLLVKRLLGDFGEELPTRRFVRIGRSLIINLEALRSVGRLQGSGALLEFAESAETLVIGRAATFRLRQMLGAADPSDAPPR